MTKKVKLPKEILVYVCDYDNDEPLFAAVESIDDIPDDEHGAIVGVYTLNRAAQFTVKRELG